MIDIARETLSSSCLEASSGMNIVIDRHGHSASASNATDIETRGPVGGHAESK